MGTIASIIADLKYGRTMLLESFEGLSGRERTEMPVYDDWTIKDVLAHIIGWDEFVLEVLPLIVQDRADEIAGVDAEVLNRQSQLAWQDKTFAQVLAAVQSSHQQILDFVSALDHVEIDKRHKRNGRIVTIRSYVIDIMLEHERQHALEIEEWRKQLDQTLDPMAIREELLKSRAEFMNILDHFEDDDVLDKSAVGTWSISDVVGHLADWEKIMLDGAHHIYDPSQPAPLPLADNTQEWNAIMAAERVDKSWPENYHDLRRVQMETDSFVAALKPGDWRLRGPYPWPDTGTLAELITNIAEHYIDHLPGLEQWYAKKSHEPNP